jgi:hypothetical protein
MWIFFPVPKWLALMTLKLCYASTKLHGVTYHKMIILITLVSYFASPISIICQKPLSPPQVYLVLCTYHKGYWDDTVKKTIYCHVTGNLQSLFQVKQVILLLYFSWDIPSAYFQRQPDIIRTPAKQSYCTHNSHKPIYYIQVLFYISIISVLFYILIYYIN